MSRLGTLPWRLTLVAAVTVTLAAGCTEDPPAPVNPDAVPESVVDTVAGSAPAPAERCHKSGNTPASKVVVTTADDVHLAGVRFGAGPRGVLLLPQRGADLCPWWDYALELTTAGFHVLAIDVRGTGYSEEGTVMDYTADAAAGIAELRRAGAERVVIIGASMGAATALVTAGRLPDQVAGVVSLSYPNGALDVTGGAGSGPKTPDEAAPLITAPVLLAYTIGDRMAAKPDDLVAKVAGPDKRLVGRPGVSHGWDMLRLGDDDVRPDVLAFLQSYA